jgi:hypothetical protein
LIIIFKKHKGRLLFSALKVYYTWSQLWWKELGIEAKALKLDSFYHFRKTNNFVGIAIVVKKLSYVPFSAYVKLLPGGLEYQVSNL